MAMTGPRRERGILGFLLRRRTDLRADWSLADHVKSRATCLNIHLRFSTWPSEAPRFGFVSCSTK